MAEPLKKDEALAAAVREAFQRHMEIARQASQALKEKQPADPSASLSSLTSSASTQVREPRLAVPNAANDAMQAVALAAPVAANHPTSPAPVAATSASLSHLVAVASPQKSIEPEPEPRVVEAVKAAPADTIPIAEAIPATDAISATDAVALAEVPVASNESQAPSAESVSLADETAQLISAPDTAALDETDDNGVDFGEALFIEIAPDQEKSSTEPPKMPKAASLDTPLREPLSQSGADDLEFRQPPSRERPRMSTASPTASPPQDLDLLTKALSEAMPASTDTNPATAKVEQVIDRRFLPATGKTATRFGVATSAKSPPATAGKTRSFARPVKFKVPVTLVASVVLAGGIAGVGAYFWSNPGKLEALSVLVAPPAQPETSVAVTTPSAKTPIADNKIDTPLPATQVASTPTSAPPPISQAAPAPAVAPPPPIPAVARTPDPAPPPSSIASIVVPDPAPATTTHSVSTVAINLDEVDEAVQSARELTETGDIDGARAALDSFKTGSDPRALFALAETYDPAVIKDSTKADANQAKIFYEAAAKAGSRDNTADRIARLALAHTN